MPTKIYVGNLPWRATDEQLTTMFSAHGDVTEARIVTCLLYTSPSPRD
ncbi:MAG: hypothetical protein EBX59_08940, partial [Betaproteobacteria bacterium]|nr:hypothetical protein [Betaproteobacteria bacterium]